MRKLKVGEVAQFDQEDFRGFVDDIYSESRRCGFPRNEEWEADFHRDFTGEADENALYAKVDEWISENCPIYCYPYFDGFKYYICADIDSAMENADIIVNDCSRKRQPEIPDDFTGLLVHVSDHGNVSLYEYLNGNSTEIWAIV